MSVATSTIQRLRGSRGVGHAAACVGLAALTVAVFSNALRYEFVNFDDWFLVEQEGAIRSLSWHGLSRMLFWASDQGVWLPLRVLSYAVDYRLWGLNAFGFHLTSLAFHVANVLLAYAVLNLVLGRRWLAALGAAWFAVHPAQVESVTWVSGRRDVLYGFFFLLALLAFARHGRARGWRKWALYGASLALTGLSLLSKASGMMLPAVLFLAALVFGDEGWSPWHRVADFFRATWRVPRMLYGTWLVTCALYGIWILVAAYRPGWRPWWIVHPAVVLLGAPAFIEANRLGWHRLAAVVPHGALAVAVTIRHFQFASQSDVIKGELFGKHLASMPWIFASYWRLLFFPMHLSTPQARVPIQWSETEGILLAALVAVGVAVAAWWAAPRRSLAVFCLGWWFLLLLPFSNLVPLSMLVAERYLYLPLLGAAALGAAIVGSLATRWKWPTVACALAVVGLFSLATHERNRVWSDSRLFWWDGLSKWPAAPVPRIGLADAYVSAQNLPLAWRQYMAILLPAGMAYSQNPEHIRLANRGILLCYDRLGRQLEAEGRLPEALDVFETTVRQMPNELGPRAELAKAYERRGMIDQALEQVRAVQRIDPKYPGLEEWLRRLEQQAPKRDGK